MTLVIGQKVTTVRYPGVWEVIETDEHMSRLKREPAGAIFVPTSSCTPFEGEVESALTSSQLLEISSAVVRKLAPFANPAMTDKMEQLQFTEGRLFRDMTAELIVTMVRAGVDVVDILADAMNLIGAEVHHKQLYDAAERVKNP